MQIDSIFCEDAEEMLESYTLSSTWNGRKVEVFETMNHQISFVARAISYAPTLNFAKPLKISPMSGGANVSVEKDSKGNTTVEVEVEHTSNDGTYEVKAEASVDQDGNVSGKASVGINWDKD
jgi:hypothetical protein